MLSEIAVPVVRQTYTYLEPKVLERFIRQELTEEAIVKIMGNGMNYALIERDGETAGFIAYDTHDDTIHLDKLYILENSRGCGTGGWAIEWLFGVAKTQGYRNVELTVVDLNIDAVKFYRKHGFERIGPERGYATKRSIMRRTFRSAELFETYMI